MTFLSAILFCGLINLQTDSSKFCNAEDTIRINHFQFLGSHNSYRIKTYDPLWNEMKRLKHPMTKSFVVKSWNYTHQPLDTQLSVYGMRSLELDIYYDPIGGRFYNQQGKKKIKEESESKIEDLKKPGMKVMHVPDYDYQTHHYLFTDALKKIKTWSDENPNHEPLFIMVEMKEIQFMKFFYPFKYTSTLKFSQAAVDSIDAEIESVFGKDSPKIITPDSLRGEEKCLRDAILKKGWPALDKAKGKIFFVLMGSEKGLRNYLKDHENLSGRKMFVFEDGKDQNSAFIKVGNPLKAEKDIRKWVEQGFIVRTRSDAGTREARKNSYKRFEAALRSGAQIISTDYYAGDKCFLDGKTCSGFKITLSGNNIFRISPVFAK